jgi:hypothetical protein
MKVYRIQDEHGDGPFHTAKKFDGYCPGKLHVAVMPTPCKEKDTRKFHDLPINVQKSCRFAFPSKEALERWVSAEDMEYLRQHGFDVVELEVEPLMQSANQVIQGRITIGGYDYV